jgi:hypothetical protein
MGAMEDPFEALVADETANDFAVLSNKPKTLHQSPVETIARGACIARLDGFDLEDQPLISGMTQLPGEVVPARTTVLLLRETIGADVVVLCEQGDPQRPIIMGVLRSRPLASADPDSKQKLVSVQADKDRYVISAEREIVLRCGDSSITLTRAGKVIIKGSYILSRSTGYNKIKGAAIDIN